MVNEKPVLDFSGEVINDWLDDSPSPCEVLEPVMTGLFPQELVRAVALAEAHHVNPK